MSEAAEAGQRPVVTRLRSNSVPLAIKLMDCTEEEAGLLFSAAERASARRRKAQSLDDTSAPLPTRAETAEQLDSPLYEDAEEQDDDSLGATTPPSRDEVTTPPPHDVELAEATPPLSPEIKNYNNDMAEFVKQRLQDMTLGDSAPAMPDQTREAGPNPTYLDVLQRPPLRSHFSNWSTMSTPLDEVEIVDLAHSPPLASEELLTQVDDEDVQLNYAYVVRFRRKDEMERSASPSYFSRPHTTKQRARSPGTRFDFPLPPSFEGAKVEKACTPLIDLDASQPDIRRMSQGAGLFFDLLLPDTGSLVPSPMSAMHGSQHLPSPRSIPCST